MARSLAKKTSSVSMMNSLFKHRRFCFFLALFVFNGCFLADSVNKIQFEVISPQGIEENPIIKAAYQCSLNIEFSPDGNVSEDERKFIVERYLQLAYASIEKKRKAYIVKLLFQNRTPPHFVIDSMGKPIYLEYQEVTLYKKNLSCEYSMRRYFAGRSKLEEPEHTYMLQVRKLVKDVLSVGELCDVEIKVSELEYNPGILEVVVSRSIYSAGDDRLYVCTGSGCYWYLYIDQSSLQLLTTYPEVDEIRLKYNTQPESVGLPP